MSDHKANEAETSVATQDEEYNLYRISLGMSLKKQRARKINPGTGDRIWSSELPCNIFYNVKFSTKIYKTCKEIIKYDPKRGKWGSQ